MKRGFAFLLMASLLHSQTVFALGQGTFLPERGVVFGPEHITEFLRPCSRSGPEAIEGTWSPNAEIIGDLEARLPKVFRDVGEEEAKSQGVGLPDASDYYRQYIGLVIHGRKVVYINAFGSFVVHDLADVPEIHRKRSDWRMSVQGICDGGIGGFGAEYDPENKSFRHVEFDGCMCHRVSDEKP